ncbi:hypothetical protein H0H87_010927 [Tephrocybe sp. NHM501043]|nr:hypothetical protein H0H87_010927 [Tephrocybe sp. NHM501043]
MTDSLYLTGCLSHPDVSARLQKTRSLQIGDLANPGFVQWLLSTNRLSLEHLDFSVLKESFVLGDDDLEKVTFHLEDFPVLKSLALSKRMSLPCIERILGDPTMKGHPLETLRFAPVNKDPEGWCFVDKCLQRSVWQNLRLVEFILHDNWTVEEISAFLSQFPKLNEQGILRVSRSFD